MKTCPQCGGTFYCDEKPFVEHVEKCRKAAQAGPRMLNESAIRDHALKCSKLFRAGKFTRVGEDFIEEVQTDVECIVRSYLSKSETLHPPLPPEGRFTTGALLDKIEVNLNNLIGRIIQNKIQKQPSCGCTARATR